LPPTVLRNLVAVFASAPTWPRLYISNQQTPLLW
jgi:hypothetical protein